MALYRNVSLAFWSDPKTVDDFTPEDKYFYLYILTNPHTNLAGCYEISMKHISDETGYSKDTINRLLVRFEKVHNVIRYSNETKEILILNWYKHNWTSSIKFLTAVDKQIEEIKNEDFKKYLVGIRHGDTVSISESTPIDATDAIAITDAVPDSEQQNEFIDFETAWINTLDLYPKQTYTNSAKEAWMDKLIPVLDKNKKEVATSIYNATKMYVNDYKENNPDDENFKFIQRYDVWLKEDCDTWIRKYERSVKNA